MIGDGVADDFVVFDAEPHNVLASPHQDNNVLVLVTISVLCSGCSMEHAIASLVAGNCRAQRYLVWVSSLNGRESCGVGERGRCKMNDDGCNYSNESKRSVFFFKKK